jgi:hypothetical protein
MKAQHLVVAALFVLSIAATAQNLVPASTDDTKKFDQEVERSLRADTNSKDDVSNDDDKSKDDDSKQKRKGKQASSFDASVTKEAKRMGRDASKSKDMSKTINDQARKSDNGRHGSDDVNENESSHHSSGSDDARNATGVDNSTGSHQSGRGK